jgi:flagellar protein FlbD
MIALRRLNGKEFILNADYIESVESTPDTVVTLTNGKKLIVRNTIEELVRKVVKYKQLCFQAVQIVNSRKDTAAGTAQEQ